MRSEPLIRISKRDSISKPRAWSIRGIALLLSLAVSGLVIFLLVKLNPLDVFSSMARGSFGEFIQSANGFQLDPRLWKYLRDMMLLACIAIGLAPAFRMRFWNIGAEGQMLVGGIATAFWLINFSGKMPTALLLVCMAVSAILAGGLWGMIPGFFKARWNANETLFTLMMNYIAIQFTSYCVAKWENPFGSNTVGIIPRNGTAGRIGNMFSAGFNKDFMWVVVIVLLLAALMYCYMRYTKHGYEIAVVGESENTARYAGIRVPLVYVRTMALSGAVEGFAGFLAVSAISQTISTSTANGRGFTAIIVAWLAKMNPFVMILISALLMFLEKGAVQIATDYGLNEYAAKIITGIVLFFVLGSEFFINYQVKFRGAAAGKEAASNG